MKKLKFRELKALVQGNPDSRIQIELRLPLLTSLPASVLLPPALHLSLCYLTTQFFGPFVVTSQGKHLYLTEAVRFREGT